jgi:plasmid maintenance system antidote protein VapI
MENTMPLHYGETVEKIIRREGHSLTEVANLLNVNRRTVYNWFLKPRLTRDTIQRIGMVIKHDFSAEFPALFTAADFRSETKEFSSMNPGDRPFIPEADDWKLKYTHLQQRYESALRRKSLLELKNRQS